jgi:hypothetical protein
MATTDGLERAWQFVDAALPSGWVMQLNIWRPEDFAGERAYRYTASAGPNAGPEDAWVTGRGDTPADALSALWPLLPKGAA